MFSPLANKILPWYDTHARQLPWRRNPNPYTVWVSEIMLQQTRVETVLPYYNQWMERFPDLPTLAAASQQDVLSIWEGLGYYGRARNLHQAAGIVMTEFGGKLPKEVRELRKLPGIGRNTAGAIASLAYNLSEPVLDGNVRRILTRVFHVQEPVRSPTIEKQLWKLAKSILPDGRTGDYNQALMDLGAIVCTPRNPSCRLCPLEELCLARKFGVEEHLPVVAARPKVPHYTATSAIIQRDNKILITQRPEKGLLGGLWEFPGGKLQSGEAMDVCLVREIREKLGVDIVVGDLISIYHHAYTHFRVTMHPFYCTLADDNQPRVVQLKEIRWVTVAEMQDYPMGKIDRSIAKKLSEGIEC
jgi:A/G-specific adenine glycosylase